MLSKLQTTLLFALVAALVLTSGCAPKQTELSTADNGRQVAINAGAQLVVTLAGNPTTGYTWEAKDLDTSLLQQLGEAKFTSDNPGLLGAGGTQSLTFKTLKTGTTTLTLVYHRPWETDVEPIDTFSVTITAK